MGDLETIISHPIYIVHISLLDSLRSYRLGIYHVNQSMIPEATSESIYSSIPMMGISLWRTRVRYPNTRTIAIAIGTANSNRKK